MLFHIYTSLSLIFYIQLFYVSNVIDKTIYVIVQKSSQTFKVLFNGKHERVDVKFE